MLRYTDIILVTQRNSSTQRRPQFTKGPHIVASSDAMQTFCEADNTKSDEMKIVFNCNAGVGGKDKQLKQ